MSKSVAFYTLGCKLNYAETSTIGRQLQAHGLEKKEFQQGADIYVINTCSVTENADKKCKKVVKEAKYYNPNAFIVIIGCYAQLKPKEIARIEGVNMVLGAAEKFNLVEHLKEIDVQNAPIVLNGKIKETNVFIPGFSVGDRTRSFLKVQDGCDYFCSFCTIPLARGKSRSNTIEETVKVARQVAETNIKEVVLTGVNIGDFGVYNDENFFDLLKELDKVEGIDRYRISSIEPNLLSNEIIDFVAQSQRIAPHFHIPLQSGSDTMLKLMRRKYLSDLYVNRVEHIRRVMPNAAIGVDVIVGFPQETDEEFLITYEFLRDLDISYLHVFPYSERANTTAKKLEGKVPEKVKQERSKMLRILSEKKRRSFYEQHLGKTFTVLFEAEEMEGKMNGFTENYIKVEAPYDPLLVNELVQVQLIDINENGTVNVLEFTEELVHV
jgi:threonylcarbamoyladenosine tRNA methylthiotransferase MtaB